MTDPQELIKQSESICKPATPGPWSPIDDYDGVAAYHGWRGLSCPNGYGGYGGSGLVFATHEWDVGLKEADIEFIAAARTLVPELAKALETATVERDVLDRAWKNAIRERDEARAELAKLKAEKEV